MNTYDLVALVVTICCVLLITSPIWLGIAYGIGKVIDRRKVKGIMPNNTPTGRVWPPAGYRIATVEDMAIIESVPQVFDIESVGVIRRGRVETFTGSGKSFNACLSDNCRANCCR